MSYEYDTAYPPKLLFLNSANARYVQSESLYIFDFNESLMCPPNHAFLLSVPDAQIPYAWYQINQNNNRYYINNQAFTISEGNYNILELLDALRINHPILSFSYTETTNRVKISSNQIFRIANDTSFEPFLRMLGFRFDIYDDQTEYESDSVVNLSGYSAVYIYSNLTSFNLDSTAKRGSNVIARIPVNSTANGIIFYTSPPGSIRQLIKHNALSEIRLQLFDSLYFPLFLNHVDWAISLQIEVVRVTEEPVDPARVIPVDEKQVRLKKKSK